MQKILITGGSGLVGSGLTQLLLSRGYNVEHLSRVRNSRSGVKVWFWNVAKQQIEKGALTNVDYIIHLAGAGIADKRWTPERKKIIVESRVKTIELIHRELIKNHITPKAVISSSGINYYGNSEREKIFNEKDEAGTGFLADTCAQWENAVAEAQSVTRTVILRMGSVLAKDAGMLGKLTPVINWGFGAAIGSGHQYVPWVHLYDICQMYLFAIENSSLSGIYNAVAPEQVTNRELIKGIAGQIRRSVFLPNIPDKVVQLLFGELSEVLLTGCKASCEKIQKAGFKFSYPTLACALHEIYG